jgi:hypothetical protein
MDNLWFVSLAEARDEMLKADAYGYGLDKRKIKEFRPYNRQTFDRHRASYYFWLDLYTYKLLRWEGIHSPIYTMEPRWEQEIAYEYWRYYFSYSWHGAKADLSEIPKVREG